MKKNAAIQEEFPPQEFNIINRVFGYEGYVVAKMPYSYAVEKFRTRYKIEPHYIFPLDKANLYGAVISNCSYQMSNLIWFKESPGSGIISHEVIHSVMRVFQFMQTKPEDAEEMFASIVEWTTMEIVRKLWASLEKKTKKKKGK